MLVCVETPTLRAPSPSRSIPLSKVVHQPRAQNDGAAIALLGEGEQVVATGPVAGQPEGGDVGDGTATGHDAEGCILGMHLGCIEGVVLAVDQTVQFGQHFPPRKLSKREDSIFIGFWLSITKEPGELGGEGGSGAVMCPM